MLTDYLKFAVGNFKRRKIRSFLTMIGVFIGIAAVVSLIGLGEGLRTAIMSQFDFLGTDTLSVQAAGLALAGPTAEAPTPLTDDLAEKIERINGVEAAINRYIESATLEFNEKQIIGSVMSMPDGDHRKIIEKMTNIEAEEGRLLKDGDGRKVLLGNNFAKEGSFGRAVKAGDRIEISEIKYQVVGILKKKGNFLMDNAILVNDEALLDDFGDDDGEVNIIAVKVKDENEINRIKNSIEKLLRKERDVKIGKEDFSVESPQQTLEILNSTLFAVQLFVYIIAGISLLVGGIGIMNTMYTAVLERTKEIGVMKSIGARNSSIFALFSIESGLLGMTGGIVGIILGLIFAYGLAAIGRAVLGGDLIQAHVSLTLIIISLLFSFIVGTIAGLLPAFQASQLQPVEALRSAK